MLTALGFVPIFTDDEPMSQALHSCTARIPRRATPLGFAVKAALPADRAALGFGISPHRIDRTAR